MDSVQKKQEQNVVVQWPEPAHLKLYQDQSAEATCTIEFADGGHQAGRMIYFTGRDNHLVFRPTMDTKAEAAAVDIDLQSIKQIHLTETVAAEAYDAAHDRTSSSASGKGDGTATAIAQTQVYSVEFNDGEILSGETAGYVSMPNGIFLYSQAGETTLRRAFIPKSAIAYFQVGDPLGRLLLREHAVSEDDLKHAVEKQEEMRKHLLGEYLLTEAYVTQEQLDEAMALQKTKPNLRLGEALIAMKAFTADELDAALARQRSDRSRPLTQILIEMGVLDEATLKKVHDRKMGRPSVSIASFRISSSIRRKIPEATARYFGVIPLAIEDGALIVGCVAPPDATTLSELTRLAGMRVAAVIAKVDEIRLKQDELYASPASPAAASAPSLASFRSANGNEQPQILAAAAPSVDPRSLIDSSIDRLFEQCEPINLVEQSNLASERVLLFVAQRLLAGVIPRGILDIHVEAGERQRRTTISFRPGASASPEMG